MSNIIKKFTGVGEIRPVNKLNGNSQNPSQLVRSTPTRPPSIPPPAKRQKNGEHTHAHFAVVSESEHANQTTPRKRSLDNISDSQQTLRSQSSNAGGSQFAQPHIQEFRYAENFIRLPPTKRRRHGRTERLNGDMVGEMPLLGPDPDDSDGDVVLVEGPRSSAASQAQQVQQPIQNYAGRFQGATRLTRHTVGAAKMDRIIDNMGPKKTNLKSVESSPDELAPEAQDMRERVPTKRPVTPSPSLSKKGDITRTKFSGSSHTRPQSSKETTDELDCAAEIIGSRLRILQAISGQFAYNADKASSADECFLKVREVSHILLPSDLDGRLMTEYSYLTVNLKKTERITLPSKPDCRIVSMFRRLDATISGSQKLIIEFQSREDLDHFVEWVTMDKEGIPQPEIIVDEQDKLNKELDHVLRQATRSKVVQDDDVGDDMKLIKHNVAARVAQAKSINRPYPPISQRKTKDLMRPFVSQPLSNRGVMVIPDEHQRRQPLRQSRTTRSTYVLRSPSVEPKLPEPESWTVNNPGWERNWRNSLVFPPHGKNRATVDKEDIPRLDEGQFLNDNLLIFYLRYLQHSLEAKRPDLARRIYFQNTFFYEKLKSGRTSQGINFDSVKAWTSRVDLFTKDFIIVPINEFAHWYVAIIYNAPKLLPSSDKTEPTDTPSNDGITIEEDADDSGRVSSASPHSGKMGKPPSAEAVMPTAQIDVTNYLSLSDPEMQKTGIPLTDHEQDIEVVGTKNDSRADVDQIPPPNNDNLLRKKTGKRQSIGLRKYNLDQPRIITLDSLALAHSPACSCLRQYLIAELKDKKGIEIPTPGALGMTAKYLPQQSNHCDCGLYLLGYIQEFLRDPDRFVRSLLQHDNEIAWNLDPSQLRSDIRDLVFGLQKEQQDREDAFKEEKRKAGLLKKRKPVAEQQPLPKDMSPVKEQVPDQHTSETVREESVAKEDGNVPVNPKARSPTPGSLPPENRPASELEENPHIPGSFPQSPFLERANAVSSPTATNVDNAMQMGTPKFVSPLPGSTSGSSPTRPMVVDDSDASLILTQGPAHTHSIPKQIDSPRDALRIQDRGLGIHHYPAVRPQNQEEAPTTSPFFAGRQPGDKMASAKLHDDPAQPQEVVDISD
ncbi:cysteine proteinase [Hypoxylon crocopeplum]|nr:cysteine proteinase [Hypoxylon crocopeplum]